MAGSILPIMLSTAWFASLFAGIFATGFGASISAFANATIRRRSAATNALALSDKDRMRLRLQRGAGPLLGISNRMLETLPPLAIASEYACEVLAERSMRLSQEALVSWMISVAILAGMLGFAITLSPAFGIAIMSGTIVVAVIVLKSQSEKRDERMREEVPDAIRSLAVAFKSGHSLPQVLSSSAEECGGYVGKLFDIASDRLDMGEPTAEALSILERSNRIPELTFVAVALDIQHQSGGAIAPVLESAIESVECELNLIRSLRVQTAQIKLSATIVTVMPFILIACFSMMSPGFLEPFFSSFLGMAVFALAMTMQIAGIMAVRRMLRAEVA